MSVNRLNRPHGRSLRVVVAHHDPAVASAHARSLNLLGWCSVTGIAHRAHDLLGHVGSNATDLVLLDLGLPDMAGPTVIRRLHSRTGEDRPPPSTIAVTGVRDADIVRAALALGVVDYLLTPVATTVLIERVQRWHAFLRILESPEINQHQIDAGFASLHPRPPTLPKGLSTVTARLVADTLRAASDPLSATVVAAHTGLSRVSARRYLTYLVDH